MNDRDDALGGELKLVNIFKFDDFSWKWKWFMKILYLTSF